jgi:hypothetical protein
LILLCSGIGVTAYVNHTGILQYDSYIANQWMNSTSIKFTGDLYHDTTNYTAWIESIAGGSVNGTAIDVTSIDSSTYSLDGTSLNARLGGNWGSTDITTTGDVEATNVNATTEFYRGGTSLTDLLAGIAGGTGVNVTESNYIIYKDGSTYYAQNGFTGLVDFTGATASTVINSAMGALTGGRTWQEKVVVKGIITITAQVQVPSYTILDFSQAKFDSSIASNTQIIVNSDPSGGNTYIEIIVGDLDGNNLLGTDGIGVYLTKCSYSTVRGGTIHDINSYNGRAVDFNACQKSQIVDVTGIGIGRQTGMIRGESSDCDIINCRAYDQAQATGGSFTIYGGSGATLCTRCRIIGCTVNNAVSGCEIYQYADDCSVEYCNIYNIGMVAIQLGVNNANLCTNLKAIGNTIKNTNDTGIIIFADKTIVSGNTIASIIGVGIGTHIEPTIKLCSITGNEITGFGNGIEIGRVSGGSSWNTITGNTITSSLVDCGIQAYSGSTYNRISNNIIYIAARGVIFPSGANYNDVSDNQFYVDIEAIGDAGTGNVADNNRTLTY